MEELLQQLFAVGFVSDHLGNLIELCLDRLITADQPVITLCILVLVKGDTGVLRNAPLYQARCTVPASVSPPESASTSSIRTS